MRTALVSNGARRIGRYLERSFMREGYAVAILCNGSRYEADHLGLGASLWRTSDTLAGKLAGRNRQQHQAVGTGHER